MVQVTVMLYLLIGEGLVGSEGRWVEKKEMKKEEEKGQEFVTTLFREVCHSFGYGQGFYYTTTTLFIPIVDS